MEGTEKDLKKLELLDQAASSLSDSDLVDAMIHSCARQFLQYMSSKCNL